MGYRLGCTLYWVCLVLIALYAMFWLAVLQGSSLEVIRSELSDWTTVLTVSSPVLALYGLGRAFRYVLSASSLETCADSLGLICGVAKISPIAFELPLYVTSYLPKSNRRG